MDIEEDTDYLVGFQNEFFILPLTIDWLFGLIGFCSIALTGSMAHGATSKTDGWLLTFTKGITGF